MKRSHSWKTYHLLNAKPGDLIFVFGGPCGGHKGTLISKGRYNGEATLRLKFKDREIDVYERHCQLEKSC